MKGKITLDDLKVQSFATESAEDAAMRARLGTVQAYEATAPELGCVVNPFATQGCVQTYGCGGGQAPTVIPVCQPVEQPVDPGPKKPWDPATYTLISFGCAGGDF